jgi:hypothetical protein
MDETVSHDRINEWNERANGWLSLYMLYKESLSVTGTIEPRRAKKRTKTYKVTTQQIRRELIREMRDLQKVASLNAKNLELNAAERIKWADISGDLAAKLNQITKTYEELEIEKSIDELNEYVRKNIG